MIGRTNFVITPQCTQPMPRMHHMSTCATYVNSDFIRFKIIGGSPFYKGQKIAPLYMQSLVPRAIAIIENGGQAKYFGGKFNFPCACVFGCDFLDFSRGKSSTTFF